MAGAKTENLTILLTDIEDFTPKTSRKTRADIVRMIDSMFASPSTRAKSPLLITMCSVSRSMLLPESTVSPRRGKCSSPRRCISP